MRESRFFCLLHFTKHEFYNMDKKRLYYLFPCGHSWRSWCSAVYTVVITNLPGVDGSPQSGHVHTLCYLLIKNNSVPLGFLEFQMLCIYNVLTIFLTYDIKPLMKVNWPATSYFILISDFCVEYQQSCTKSTVLLFSQV